MIVKGDYRDVLSKKSMNILDSGWTPNTIVEDCGNLLAAMMKKDLGINPVGIEYIAAGSYGDKDIFMEKVAKMFRTDMDSWPLKENGNWIWAKKIIQDKEITYLDKNDMETDNITNHIKIEVTFERNEPLDETFDFREFALLSVAETTDKKGNVKFDTGRLFFINYVSHGLITKDESMQLSRTIKLRFPLNGEEE